MTPTSTQVSRQKLLEAAMRVFAESGFRGATTRRIAEAAGVNEVTLFRQFKSKTALINEVAELYARRRSEEALPAGAVDPLKELADWCAAHMGLLRNSRDMIRKCMAEVQYLPHMGECMRRGPDVVHRQLQEYAMRLVRQHKLTVSPDDVRVACMMLQGSMFADAMGRDIMPDLYPPVSRAAAGYARMFLRMLGAEAVADEMNRGQGSSTHNGARRRSRRRST
ncbi:MAG TPA: helix-turn-helix domain-containing protein [Gemmatimonadaceae bacterium]